MASVDPAALIGTVSADMAHLLDEPRPDGFLRTRESQSLQTIGAYVTEPLSRWIVVITTPEDVALAVARSPHLPRLRDVYFACWPLYPEPTKAELLRRFPTMPRG